MSEQEAAPSRRDTITAAYDEANEPEEAPVQAATSEPATPAEQPSTEAATPTPAKADASDASKGRDTKGRFQPAKNGATTVQTKVAPGVVKPTASAMATTPAPATATLKPPQSWKPAPREKWGALPLEVQEEVIRHDREVSRAMQESSEARKNWSAFQATVAPYEGMIRAEGSDPLRATAELYKTAQALRTAPPQHKAALVAGIIKTYGVDINQLASALDGQAAPQQQQTQQQYRPQDFRDPRLDQYFAQRQQELSAKGQQAVEEFAPQAEFFDDVRHDMADLMELARKRNVELSLEEAYNRAVASHPEVSRVLQQREAAKQANASHASTQRSRIASSSLRSQPGGVSNTPAPTDRRAAIAAAWDEHVG